MARRPAIATIAIGLLAAGAVIVAVLVIGSPATSTAQERTVTVARGVIQSTVSGSGNLEPANQVDLNFATSGEITHVYVKEGEHVGEGQLLAKLDDSAAKVDVAEAQASLQSAQDTLDEVQAQGSTTSSTTSTASTASVSHAVMARVAQSSPGSGNSGSAGSSGSSGSGSGSGSSGSGSGSSSGSGSTISLAAAEANVESAQLSVTSAEKALAATTLRAPMAGTIAAINGDVGSTVSSGSGSGSSNGSNGSNGSNSSSIAGALGGGGSSSGSSNSSNSSSSFITLAQISRFKMDVSLSESDIGSVKVGQPATVTVNAASGEQFAAHVTHIGVLSSSSGGGSSSSAVSYPVTLTLDQTGKHLKAGMSATADIVTSQVSGIAVPSQALSGSTVTVEDKNGKQTTRQVQTGVVGDSTTQIVSGLSVGDTVVVRSSTAAAGATGAGSDQINSALRNRLGRNGFGGGLGGSGLGGGGGNFRVAPGGTP